MTVLKRDTRDDIDQLYFQEKEVDKESSALMLV